MEHEEVMRLGALAKEASLRCAQLGQREKNDGLLAVADALVRRSNEILAANAEDVEKAEQNGMKASLVDRLRLTDERIRGMAEGLRQVAALPDPIGEGLSSTLRPNGLRIEKRRVPLGVVGIIYEARPNVTIDAFGLCFKTGNAVILRGGRDAFLSNQALVGIARETLASLNLPEDAVNMLTDPSREGAAALMTCDRYVDVLIPRGGAELIARVKRESTVPVIETGTGNCHIYIDEYADRRRIIPIVMNAKTQRYGVCNACESLVVHRAVAAQVLPPLARALREKGVELRGDSYACFVAAPMKPATEEDYGTEYLDAILSIKTVDSLEEAIAHINRYSTKHSESILTEHLGHAMKFLNEVDSSCVYVNASTRFTDGFEFGLGAEVGISTQKLHARGPMGLEALTTTKYVIFGDGQIRE